MPTSRKPVARSNARLAVFSGKTRETSFQKPCSFAAAKSASRARRPAPLPPFLPGDINGKLGNAVVTRPRPIRRSGSEGNDLAVVFYDHNRMDAVEPGIDVRGGSRFGLEGGAAVF